MTRALALVRQTPAIVACFLCLTNGGFGLQLQKSILPYSNTSDRSMCHMKKCRLKESQFESSTSGEESEYNPNRRKVLNSLTSGFAAGLIAAGVGGTFMVLPEEVSAFDFPVPGTSTNFANMARKIRNVCVIMDELQRDLQQERWDLVEGYPAQLRSFVPVFTTYTDEVFASDDLPSNKGLRVALRYEVGRFFGSLERLKQATTRRDLNEAYVAYSNMAIHFDRYLKAGNLYTYIDPLVSTEPLFEKVSDALVYSNPKTDPPEVRDLVVLCQGPDKGKTGIVIGIFPDTKNVVVKLDRFSKTSPIREIKVGKKDFHVQHMSVVFHSFLIHTKSISIMGS